MSDIHERVGNAFLASSDPVIKEIGQKVRADLTGVCFPDIYYLLERQYPNITDVQRNEIEERLLSCEGPQDNLLFTKNVLLHTKNQARIASFADVESIEVKRRVARAAQDDSVRLRMLSGLNTQNPSEEEIILIVEIVRNMKDKTAIGHLRNHPDHRVRGAFSAPAFVPFGF